MVTISGGSRSLEFSSGFVLLLFWKVLSLTIAFLSRFAKEQNFTLQQISAFFTLLKVMLDNIKGEQIVSNVIKISFLLTECCGNFGKIAEGRIEY